MSITASYLVQLQPRTITGGSSDLETNGLLLTKSARLPSTTPAVRFGSATAVSDFFGPESDEAQFALQYFTGLTNQRKAPDALIVGRRFAEAAAAWIRSAPLTLDLEALKAISDGTLKITVDGTEKTAATVNLSEATSLSDVAEKLATAITGVTGAYDSATNTITLTSSTTGAESTIGFASAGEGGTNLSEKLGFTQAAGAVISQGVDAMPVAQNLQAIVTATGNWSQFTTLWEETNAEEVADYAAWADLTADYVYVFWSSDAKMADPLTQDATIASTLVDQYDCTFMLYADDYRTAAFALAYPATIAWTLPQGMKVLFGKSASGIAPTITTQAEAEALDALRVSYVGQFATRNAEFQFANRGALTSSTYGFYDVLVASIWFRAKIQRAVMDLFAQRDRLPYTGAGYTALEAVIQDPINAAKNCGVIDEGLALSESQKNQLLTETGDTQAASTLALTGYYLKVTDPEAAIRAQRGSPVMMLYYAYAGSVQAVDMPVTGVL